MLVKWIKIIYWHIGVEYGRKLVLFILIINKDFLKNYLKKKFKAEKRSKLKASTRLGSW